MELTVDQALQQGIAAHREGKLQEAERLYRSILKVQPNHAHANHNLGVLAVSVGKVVDALPFFEQALESNTHIEQFWLSYIDALIKLQRSYDAKQALTDAEQLGVSAVKLDELGKLDELDGPGAQTRLTRFEGVFARALGYLSAADTSECFLGEGYLEGLPYTQLMTRAEICALMDKDGFLIETSCGQPCNPT